jgi:hypothetical protein
LRSVFAATSTTKKIDPSYFVTTVFVHKPMSLVSNVLNLCQLKNVSFTILVSCTKSAWPISTFIFISKVPNIISKNEIDFYGDGLKNWHDHLPRYTLNFRLL